MLTLRFMPPSAPRPKGLKYDYDFPSDCLLRDGVR